MKIDSLSSYIKYIENKDYAKNNEYISSGHIFRGEACCFDKRVASAFRESERSINSNSENFFHNFSKKIELYYEKISHTLNDVEKQHFTAFSQHYGLYTNLLDVTSSPFIALFFACYEKEKRGRVYVFNNEYIDVTEVLQEFSSQGIIEQNILGKLRTGNINDYNVKIYDKFYTAIDRYTEKYLNKVEYKQENDMLRKIPKPSDTALGLVCIMYKYIKWLLENDTEKETNFLNYDELKNLDKYKQIEEIKKLHLELVNYPEIIKYLDIKPKKSMNEWTFIIIDFLNYILIRMPFILTFSNKEINFLPNIIYKPITTFTRARMQSGYFIYQPYIDCGDKNGLAPLQLNPPIDEIPIENTEEILKQLDYIGINLATIYGDYDNIAKYIKNKKYESEKQNK